VDPNSQCISRGYKPKRRQNISGVIYVQNCFDQPVPGGKKNIRSPPNLIWHEASNSSEKAATGNQ
jgi:hypothetical protein